MTEKDLKLVRRTLSGDLEAWGKITSKYKEKVFGLALGIMKEPAEADDVVQDTFIRAYEKLDQFDQEREFTPWLLTIAGNIARNKLRRKKFMNPLKNPGWLESSKTRDPAEKANQEKRNHLVRDSLAELDEKYRIPLVLRYYGELTYKEISKVTDLPAGTVKTRLNRAKTKLTSILGGAGK